MVTPEMRHARPILTRGNKAYSPGVCAGTTPNALEMNQHVIAHGRMFNDLDDELARNVCVIGTATRDELFGSPEETGRPRSSRSARSSTSTASRSPSSACSSTTRASRNEDRGSWRRTSRRRSDRADAQPRLGRARRRQLRVSAQELHGLICPSTRCGSVFAPRPAPTTSPDPRLIGPSDQDRRAWTRWSRPCSRRATC